MTREEIAEALGKLRVAADMREVREAMCYFPEERLRVRVEALVETQDALIELLWKALQ